MSYAVKEIFLTLQGEGMQAGRRAVFLRFAGCNLWTGREQDRASAQCTFCDTDFVGMDGENGGRYEAAPLADRVASLWSAGPNALPKPLPFRSSGPSSSPGDWTAPNWVGVGPVKNAELEQHPPPPTPPLKGRGETRSPQRALVVITGGEPLLQLDAALIDALHAHGFEIAVETNGTLPAPEGLDWICVSPKAGTEIVQRAGDELKLVWPQPGIDPDTLATWNFRHLLIQPMDCADRDAALAASIDFVMKDPRWSLSLQTHKLLGLP